MAASEPLRRKNMIPAGKMHFACFLSAGQLIIILFKKLTKQCYIALINNN